MFNVYDIQTAADIAASAARVEAATAARIAREDAEDAESEANSLAACTVNPFDLLAK